MNGKILLAVAFLLVLAAGYIIGKSTATNGAETKAVSAIPARPDRPSATKARHRASDDNALLTAILGGRPVSEIPPADLAALIGKLSKYDPDMDPLLRAKQTYQYQLLLAKLSPADLTAIADTITADPELIKSGSLGAVLAALAKSDPSRALDWVSASEENARLLPAVINAIAKEDPALATDLYREAQLNGTFSNNELWSASNGIVTALAKLGAEPLMTFIDSLSRQQQGNMVYNSLRSLPKEEQIKLLDMLHLRNTEDESNKFSLSYILSNTISTDLAGTTEWFSKLPDGEDKDKLRVDTIGSLFQRNEKEAALEWMREAIANSPGEEKKNVMGAIQSMSHNNPRDIPSIAALLPAGSELTYDDLESAASNSIYSGASSMADLAAAIPDPAEKAKLIAGTLEKMSSQSHVSYRFNATDFEILSRRIAGMGLTGEDATLVNEALAAAKEKSATGGR